MRDKTSELENMVTYRKIISGCLCLTAAMYAGARDMKVLGWGNSAWRGPVEMLPRMAAASGHTVEFRCLRASAEAYVKAVQAAEAGRDAPRDIVCSMPISKRAEYGYVALESDYNACVRLEDELRSEPWDAIVIGLNTHMAVDEEAFALLDSMAAYSRNIRPEARICIFQNLAPPNNDQNKIPAAEAMLMRRGLLKTSEILTEDKWSLLSSSFFTRRARALEAEPILANDILYWIRRDDAWGYQNIPSHPLAQRLYHMLEYGQLPPHPTMHRHEELLFRIGFIWNAPDAEDRPEGAPAFRVNHHPTLYGEYLTAAAFYEVLLDESVAGNAYRPPGANPERIELLQRLVHEIMRDPERFPLIENAHPAAEGRPPAGAHRPAVPGRALP